MAIIALDASFNHLLINWSFSFASRMIRKLLRIHESYPGGISAARSAWCVHRRRRSGHGDPLDVERFVQRQADRSADVYCRGCADRHRCFSRVLYSGTEGDARRSHGCAEIRIVLRTSYRNLILGTTSDRSEGLRSAAGRTRADSPQIRFGQLLP